MNDEHETKLSILGNLKSRRAEILENEHLDLPVPRWSNPEIIVRYSPLGHAEIRKIQLKLDRVPKARRLEEEVQCNADLLIRACQGVYARVDGQDYSLRPGDPKGEWTTFDPDLAENLGLSEDATAREVCRALFATDGDLISAARAVINWSGYKTDEADEALQGE